MPLIRPAAKAIKKPDLVTGPISKNGAAKITGITVTLATIKPTIIGLNPERRATLGHKPKPIAVISVKTT